MLIVGISVLTTSTPATAVSASETVTSVSFVTAVAQAADQQPQALTIGDTIALAVSRDTFTVGELPPPAPEPEVESMLAAAAPAVGGLQWPVPMGSISGGFGPRGAPCDGCSTFHKGIDIIPGVGTPINAMAGGFVVEASTYDDGGLGVHAIIEHQIDGQTVRSTYAHMLSGSLLVSVGEPVGAGQLLGNVGSTGQSTGPHLHFEIHVNGAYVDPLAWMAGYGL